MKKLTTILENKFLVKNNMKESNNYVDLGLPSGTLWCKYNLGADKETDFGLHYQFASINGFDKSSSYKISIKTTPYYKNEEYTKYNSNDILDKQDDVVYKETNGLAKLPTKEKIQELIDNTKYKWTKIDGVAGGKFTGKNGKYIFIPAAGYFYADLGAFYNSGSNGYVWSSSVHTDYSNSAYLLGFNSGYCDLNYDYRYFGFSVRGVLEVCPKNKNIN